MKLAEQLFHAMFIQLDMPTEESVLVLLSHQPNDTANSANWAKFDVHVILALKRIMQEFKICSSLAFGFQSTYRDKKEILP